MVHVVLPPPWVPLFGLNQAIGKPLPAFDLGQNALTYIDHLNALFTLRTEPAAPEHRLVGLRLVGPKSSTEKDRLLRWALAGDGEGIRYTPLQADFGPIPNSPFVYWLRPRFFELLRSERRLKDVAKARQGLATADNERFTRLFW